MLTEIRSTGYDGGLGCAAAPSLARDRIFPSTVTPHGLPRTTYLLDPLCDPRWPRLVEDHPASSVFHSTKWLSALRTVYGYEPVVITTSPPESKLTNGLVFCRINSWLTGRRSVSLPFSDHCEPLVESPAELGVIIEGLKRQVDRGESQYVEIRPLTAQPGGQSAMKRLVTYHFHSLSLRPGIEQLFHHFHKDCVQRKIRRAEREQLHYEEGTTEDLIQKFYRLLVMTRRRQYLPPQPIDWFRGLVAAFGKDIAIRVVSNNRKAVAAILTLSHKKSMTYKYGCSDAAFNNLGGTALLFWKTIQEAKQRGFEELELGRSDLDNAGLVAFKDRWGASRHSIHYWTFPQTRGAGVSVWRNQLANRLVPITPDLALKAIGKLLYKHIG